MFRLVKILNTSNLSEEVTVMTKSSDTKLGSGCVAKCEDGVLKPLNTVDYPQYMITSDINKINPLDVLCYPITEDMIFLVEYVSSIPPEVGMTVGIKSHDGYDSNVTSYSSSGKGMIVALHDDPKYVYVKFSNK